MAGVSLSLGLFSLVKVTHGRSDWAGFYTLFLLSDMGLWGRLPFIQQAAYFVQPLFGSWGAWPPRLHFSLHGYFEHLRVPNPGIGLGLVFAHVAVLAVARRTPGRLRTAACGLSFGLLFYTLFYYWTAVGLALILGWCFDRGHRALYLKTVAIGGILGLPEVITTYIFKQSASPDWAPRMGLLLPVAKGSASVIPDVTLLILVLLLPWIWIYRRDLLYLALLTLSSFVLSGHDIITGFGTENAHWLIYLGFPCMSILLVFAMLAAVASLGGRSARAAIVALMIASIAIGFYLRYKYHEFGNDFFNMYNIYNNDWHDCKADSLPAKSVVAGDWQFVMMATILNHQVPLAAFGVATSPHLSNDDWDERIALNSFLQGRGASDFRASLQLMVDRLADDNVFEGAFAGFKGPWSQNPVLAMERIDHRMRAFTRIETDPLSVVDRWSVRYVALSVKQTPPDYLSRGWRLLNRGHNYQVWERSR